jgi:hypothetical protein
MQKEKAKQLGFDHHFLKKKASITIGVQMQKRLPFWQKKKEVLCPMPSGYPFIVIG